MIWHKLVWVDYEDTKKVRSIGGHPSSGYMWESQVGNKDLWPLVSSQMVAHDLIEHQNGVENLGSVTDELEAIGGAIKIREGVLSIEASESKDSVLKDLILNILEYKGKIEHAIIENCYLKENHFLRGYLEKIGARQVESMLSWINLGAAKAEVKQRDCQVPLLNIYTRIDQILFFRVPFFMDNSRRLIKEFEIGVDFTSGEVEVKVP